MKNSGCSAVGEKTTKMEYEWRARKEWSCITIWACDDVLQQRRLADWMTTLLWGRTHTHTHTHAQTHIRRVAATGPPYSFWPALRMLQPSKRASADLRSNRRIFFRSFFYQRPCRRKDGHRGRVYLSAVSNRVHPFVLLAVACLVPVRLPDRRTSVSFFFRVSVLSVSLTPRRSTSNLPHPFQSPLPHLCVSSLCLSRPILALFAIVCLFVFSGPVNSWRVSPPSSPFPPPSLNVKEAQVNASTISERPDKTKQLSDYPSRNLDRPGYRLQELEMDVRKAWKRRRPAKDPLSAISRLLTSPTS